MFFSPKHSTVAADLHPNQDRFEGYSTMSLCFFPPKKLKFKIKSTASQSPDGPSSDLVAKADSSMIDTTQAVKKRDDDGDDTVSRDWYISKACNAIKQLDRAASIMCTKASIT